MSEQPSTNEKVSAPKRPYSPPSYRREEMPVFTAALSCGKINQTQRSCKFQAKS